MDDKSLAYFSSVNPLARKIFKDQQLLRNALGEEWDKLDWQKQEELIDDFFVDISVREKFADVERAHEYPVSFPKLKLDTGENIVVDDDFWTWQDEHSKPFNWRTKSQQDLSLDDLDAEVLSKPVKHKKKESQTNNDNVETAPRQFSVNTGGSIWESPFLQGMKKPEYLNSRPASEKSTTASRESLAQSKTPEEVNYAFTGSVDDLSSVRSGELNDRSISISSGEMLAAENQSVDNEKQHKPAKRQRSFSKSPIKTVLVPSKEEDTDRGSLVSKKDDEQNAFDNPALGHEWSSFVNDDDGPSSATPSPYKKLLKEPEPEIIDRGDNLDSSQINLMSDAKVDEYHDEILVVEQTPGGDDDALNASSLSKTGFDFLDNW